MVKVGLTTESNRLASLQKYQILDTEPETIFNNLTQLAASICEVPIALISLVDADRLWFKATIGLNVGEIPLQGGCLSNHPLIIPDTLGDDRSNNLPLVTFNPKIRFYADMPLMSREGYIIGLLCIADYQPRKLSDRQISSFKAIAEQVRATLELHRQGRDSKLNSSTNLLPKPSNQEIDLIYRQIITSLPQGAVFLSNQGVVCNPKAEDILGRKGKEAQNFLLLQPCWQAVSESLTPFTIETHPAWMALITGKAITQVVMGIPKPEGKLSWVKLDTHPLLISDRPNGSKTKDIKGVFCYFTELNTAKPVKKYDPQFISLSSDLLCVFGKDGYLKQLLNTAWETTLGYSAAELLSKPLIEFIHPEDRESTNWALANINQSQTIGSPNRWLCQDGSYKWICWNSVPIPNSDLIYGIGRDITESRLLEASLAELDNIKLALDRAAIVTIFDAKGIIKYANQNLCQLSGFNLEELIGKPIEFLDSEEQSEVLCRQIWTKLERYEIWKGEVKYKSQNGQYFWADITIVPLGDRQGNSIDYVAIGNDITDKKQLEKQFLHAQRLESIGTMAGGVSHDLNNILTPILAASQLLQLKFPEADSRTKELLKTLEINAKRGASLVKQVLSFARGLEGIKTPLTVKHIITEIQQIISQTFPKNIEIVVEIPTDLWMVVGDATQIHQVLMNLAVNARDAMNDGGVLTIHAENIVIDAQYSRLNIDAKVGSYVSISLMDTGMGIPTEIIDRIFDPFFTTKDLGQGTGLGLATVLTIIKGHNGFIKVDSKLGKGSLFKIYVPAIINADELVVIEPQMPLGKGEIILIVDDENLIVETMKTTLETYNYRVLVANDGIEAIALYAQRKQDISAVILDLMMPMMDGAQTFRILRRLNPLVKIIATSGWEEHATTNQISSVEVFLPKPYTPRDLLEKVSQILHKNRS